MKKEIDEQIDLLCSCNIKKDIPSPYGFGMPFFGLENFYSSLVFFDWKSDVLRIVQKA